jgi:hypothetical protein
MYKFGGGLGMVGDFGVIRGFRVGCFFRKHVEYITCFCLDGLS